MKREIVLLFLVNFGSAIGYSLVAPLFPSIALERGISEETIGKIMASFAISNVLITPFYSKIFNIIGKKRVFYIGLFIEVN
jgi:MFS family permease